MMREGNVTLRSMTRDVGSVLSRLRCVIIVPPLSVTGNAIQSFGYGPEGGTLLVTEPSTFLPPDQPPIISKPAPSLHGNAIKPMDSACVFSTCANLQVSLRIADRTFLGWTPPPFMSRELSGCRLKGSVKSFIM